MEAIDLLRSNDNGVFFEHLDSYFLEKSARIGCDMCAVVWNGQRPSTREMLVRCEEIPMRYDYGHFLGTDTLYTLYAVKFYPFALLESRGRMLPMMMPTITLTLDRVTEDLACSTAGLQIAGDKLPVCKPQRGETSTGSTESMSQISKWLERCKRCASRRLSIESSFVPDRLVDADASYPDEIHIIDGRDIAESSRYITLSHCWGNIAEIHDLVCRLMVSRIYEFKKGISLQRLPKTFIDAVAVARSLGIRYIWIDSLCIVQDSKEDWQRNAAVLWKLYASSYLTLAATASRNSTEGLFRTRAVATLSPGIVEVSERHPQLASGRYRCYDDMEWLAGVDDAPLNKRAWVFQERLLSPRIVHFAENQLYFECFEFRASERFADGIPERLSTSSHRDVLPPSLFDPATKNLTPIWDSIVSAYTALALTYDSDKMVAVSAIARHLSDLFPDCGSYLAGLWEHNLVGQLCWSTSANATRAEAYRAPSWSWVSVDGNVSPHFFDLANTPRDKARAIASVIEAATTHAYNPFVSFKSGIIRISAPLYRITLAKPKDTQTRAKNPGDTTELIETMSKVIPGYTGTNLRSVGFSAAHVPTGLSGKQRLNMDVIEGIMDIPSTDGPDEPGESPWRNFKMKFDGNESDHANIQTDEDFTKEELERLKPVFMPVFCTFDSIFPEIDTLRGLVLAKSGGTGFYRRIGSGTLDEYALAPFLCSLANQEFGYISSNESISGEDYALQSTLDHACPASRLRLDDFLPENWSCKTLDFIPKDFAQYEITVV